MLQDYFIVDIRNRALRVNGILQVEAFPETPRRRPRFPSVAYLQLSVPWLLLIGNLHGPFTFQLPLSLSGHEKDENDWWSKFNIAQPTDTFDFVVVGDSREGEQIRVVHRNFGHTAMTDGELVIFAGVIELNAGMLPRWSNNSGHYQPIETAHRGIEHLLATEKFSAF